MEQKQLYILVCVIGIVVLLGILGIIIYVIKDKPKKEISSSASSNTEKTNVKSKRESTSEEKSQQKKRKQRNKEKENKESEYKSEAETPRPKINRTKKWSQPERRSIKQYPQQSSQQLPQQVQQQKSQQVQQKAPQLETSEQKKKSLEIFKINKGEFIKQAFDLELAQIKNAKDLVSAEKIPFTTKFSYSGKVTPVIKHGEDPLYEVFRLMYDTNFIVAANTVANGIYIGGGFSVDEVYRKNVEETQEEAFMSVFNRLFTTLCFFAITNNKGLIERGDKNRFLYKSGIFKNNVLFSDNLFSRVTLSTFKDALYLTKGNYDCFFDYLVQRVENKTKKFEPVNSKTSIKIYSICGYDRRNKPEDQVNYNQIRLYTKIKISTMLEHASGQGVNAVVINIPGTGVHSWKTRKGDPDQKMLDAVEEGTVSAVKDFGNHFKEIVICGHRDPKNSIFSSNLKQNNEKWYSKWLKYFL
ncbi:hypothetical protein NGRA_2283 [Nosema granulosis]|uniref:Uncharacterized protein n=1 Tax=Nosema granulosis TaxID=83296 RepID=A0A9P6GXB4_9MICR|nr:hypothetical protein NGRA_2283 [Nosema granulosis]